MNLQNAAEKLNELHNAIQQAHKEAKINIRLYNGLVASEFKIREKEELVQYEYCAFLKDRNIPFREQVKVPSGIIDVLTPAEIIEIKYGSSRQKIFEAIGQLTYYSIFYPDHFQKIVITGSPSEHMKKVMENLLIEWEVFKCSLF